MLIWALAAYLVLQFVIAWMASRTIKVEDDYFVAGRRLGVFAVAMSVFATWFGAESVMGASGAIASQGLAGGRADPFGYTICLIGMAMLLAFKLREAGVLTFVDFFKQRFGPVSEKIAAVLTIPTSVIWASAQLLAMGEIVATVSGLPTGAGLLIGAAIIIGYTTIGGLLGDVITDIVQGGVLIAGLVLLMIVVVMSGDFDFAKITPDQLSLSGFDEEGNPESLIATLDTWMIPILGSLVAQEAISRFLGATSPSVARRGCFIAAGLYLVVGSIPAMLGLLGAANGFQAESQDAYLPELAQAYLDPVLYVVLMGALVSAILSTVDTTLLAISAIATRNLIEPFAPGIPEKGKVALGRVMTAFSGVVALGVAASGDTIKGLVEVASSFGSAGIVVALLFGLHTRFGNQSAAIAAMVTGAVMSFFGNGVVSWVLALFLGEEVYDTIPWYYQEIEGGFVYAVVGSLIAYIAVAVLTSRKQTVDVAAAD
jgi:SSS family transporter